ncbi:MAG: YhgE/Pip domain-containing protein [Mobiluncus porci]|uniref:YhgE/Pip domain-containing protein n=1 Tax=Mobiluncus porci TaxID=2652278 RepID=UPI0023F382DF|nr:YhgE/Pip domain-containing protein [Mobiluncus porci]MDD7542147.1 YhgE/Pip domain-containing protein [Mobiluncus porci]MDY5749006.1 YhgE/Pip domain-containing protein [Mobiluncus porci]
MRDTRRVLTRDIKRILAVPRALIIVIGVLVIPALYSWINILAFWDPYMATGELPIAVVNNDADATSDITGTVNVGSLIVDELHTNDQLGWQFLDENTAKHKLQRGDTYAMFVIPQDFSENLVKIFSGERNHPTIEYTVNEKKGAIAPKITDAGASALDVEITSAFREQVGKAIAQAVRNGGFKMSSTITETQGSINASLDDTVKNLSDALVAVNTANESIEDSFQAIQSVHDALSAADPALVATESVISDAQKTLAIVAQDTQTYSVALGKASLAAQDALNQSAATAAAAVSNATALFDQTQPQLETKIDRANTALSTIRTQIDALRSASLPEPLVADLTERLNNAEELLTSVQRANVDAAKTSERLKALEKSFSNALIHAQDATATARTQVSNVASELNSQAAQLSASLGGFSSTVHTMRASLTVLANMADELETQFKSAKSILGQTYENLQGLESVVQTAKTDTMVLSSELQTGIAKTATSLDSANIGRYLASPVKFDQQALFPIKSYGSGMAAMFINLSLWIGAFILIVIFRVEVDKEGFTWLRLGSAYIGRFILLAIFSVIQGLIVSVGALAIGVQVVNPAAFIITAATLAPLYLAIIYALAAALSYVGRTLAVVLVIMQIPGASGIYPIELMPSFFQRIYPLLPFSYGINAMRETIGGFYGERYLQSIASVFLMAFAALVLGFIGRRHLGYFTSLFFEELGRTELVVNENVQLQGVNYRLSNIIALLANRKEFAARLARRQDFFNAHYSTLVRSFTVIGLLGVGVLGVISRMTTASKPALLAIATVWGLLIVGALVALEALKRSLMRADELSHLSEEELFSRLLPYPSLSTADLQEKPAAPPESEDASEEAATLPDTESTAAHEEAQNSRYDNEAQVEA